MGSIGVSFDGRGSIPSFLGQAKAAESAGASSLWIASHLFQHDPFTLAAMALEATNRIRVVLMAISPYVVHPVQIAMATATLAARYPDRVSLCLGVGVPGDLNAAGLQISRPRATLRDAIKIVRALLRGERPADSEIFPAPSRILSTHPTVDVPLYLAASGPRMLALAGECADGVVISAGTSDAFVQTALSLAAASGRNIRQVGLVYGARSNRDDILMLQRRLAAVLRGSHHSDNISLGGTGLDQDRLRALLDRDATDDASALITDNVIATHAAAGTPFEVNERLAAYRAAGLQEIVLAGLDSVETIHELVTTAHASTEEV